MKEHRQNPLSPGEEPALRKAVSNRYDSQALFRGQQEILIEHASHTYRLRITRQDKLILTK